MTDPRFLLIAAGYVALLWVGGWVGLVVMFVHIGIMVLAALWGDKMRGPRKPYVRPPEDEPKK